MKRMMEKVDHKWKFVQNGGLIQVTISSVDDVLHIDELDPKLWTALACPVTGLEFSEETLKVIDSDGNGRVRVPDVIAAMKYIKKYFAVPDVIMDGKDELNLYALSGAKFDFGYSPHECAAAMLSVLNRKDSEAILAGDLDSPEKLFAPSVFNGDGVLTKECVSDSTAAAVVDDIIRITGGTDDLSGVKGVTRAQADSFFESIHSAGSCRRKIEKDSKTYFPLGEKTEPAAELFLRLREKIDDYFIRCSVVGYDGNSQELLRKETESVLLSGNSPVFDAEKISVLPLALCEAAKPLPLRSGINPVWADDVAKFRDEVVIPLSDGEDVSALAESEWRRISGVFAPYIDWKKNFSENQACMLGKKRINEILESGAEAVIYSCLEKEESQPPMKKAVAEMRKMMCLKKNFVDLLRNFVSFEDFYSLSKKAMFQCGVLYIDGRSCDLCFRVSDIARHSVMSALSQCFLVYCECSRKQTSEKMRIAALISNGSTDNIILGRNGIFFDRAGRDWDATVVRIIDNPVSVRQAFWSPYKKLARMIQEKFAKTASAAESSVLDKMTKVVDNPSSAVQDAQSKKTDVGTVAALSVAFTGIATVVGGLLQAFFGLGVWIPLGIAGIMLAVSLPSVIIAWHKLKQRNIGPILDASGWAVNGNVRITPVLGASLTHLPVRPLNASLFKYDPFPLKKFPLKSVIAWILVIVAASALIVLAVRHPDKTAALWSRLKQFGVTAGKAVPANVF